MMPSPVSMTASVRQPATGSLDELMDRAALLVTEGMSLRAIPPTQRNSLRAATLHVLVEARDRATKDVLAAREGTVRHRTAVILMVVAFLLGLLSGRIG